MNRMIILPVFTEGLLADASNDFTNIGVLFAIVVIIVVSIAVISKFVRSNRNDSESAEEDYSDDDSEGSNLNEEQNFKKEKTINVRVGNKYAGMDTPTLVKAILKDLNCKYEESDDHIDFLFSYQGENFVARAPDKDNPRVRLFDLDWCRCPLSNLEEMSCMQKVINTVNTRQMCSAIYYINKEAKEMVVYSKADFHLWCDMPHPDDYMRMWLGNFFFLKQNFAVDLENEKQRVGIK